MLLAARTPEKLESAREAIEQAGGEAHVHRCDLSDIDRMAAEVLERRYGQIWALRHVAEG